MPTINGTTGNDELLGTDQNDVINGLAGDDRLFGGDGNDRLFGGPGFDRFWGGAGNDLIDGGAILDRVNLSDLNWVFYSDASSGVVVNLQTGIASDGDGGTDRLVNINFVTGSDFDDTLTGSNTSNLFEQFEGGAGNDTIDGGAINAAQNNGNRATYINAPSGVVVDLAAGTAQDGWGTVDTLVNIDQVRGSTFGDVLLGSDTAYTEFFEGRQGNDQIDGRGGIDVVRYDASPSGVVVDLAAGTAQDGHGGTDTLAGIEGVWGSAFDDILRGGDPANGFGAIDGFEFFRGGAGNDLIDGGAGYDRVDYNNSPTGVVVQLGGSSDGFAEDGFGGTDTLVNIEAVRGSSFADELYGSDDAPFESLEGRGGNDLIDGGGGIDRVDYVGSPSAVTVNLNTGTAQDGWGGVDTLVNIENIRGSAFNDTLTGDAGNNRLDGSEGADRLFGLGGDDTYVVDNVGDRVYETPTAGSRVDAGGVDTVLASVDHTLSNFVEDLVMTGTGDLRGTGNSLNNFINGNSGNNVLDGRGGVDTLDGGEGSDIYLFTSASDHLSAEINDTGTSGVDEVRFAATRPGTLVLFGDDVGIERVVIGTGTGAQAVSTGRGALNVDASLVQNDLEMVGNAGANRLTGTAFGDTIDGGAGNDRIDGGSGTDLMRGGTGNDTYVVDNAGDITLELANAGTDTVESGISWTLAANIERLVLTGDADIDGTGNDLNNTLTGNGGNNTLTGAGGNNTMYGLAGDDTYVVDSIGDRVFETQGASSRVDAGGVDTVRASVNFTLGNFVENLVLTGSADVNGNGNAQGNELTGNSGNNRLDGKAGDDTLDGGGGNDVLIGGLGNDVLTGGAGDDIFRFDTRLSASSNVDQITDFGGGDRIQLENAVFNRLRSTGTLSDDFFVSGDGAVALDANDHVIYDSSTGALYYDPDGSGSAAMVQFATLTGAPALSASDILVT
jgi:Ca2+-binding RTX toxin-like protein